MTANKEGLRLRLQAKAKKNDSEEHRNIPAHTHGDCIAAILPKYPEAWDGDGGWELASTCMAQY